MIRLTDEAGGSVRGRLYCNVAATPNEFAIKSLETLGSNYALTQPRSSEERTSQLHCYKTSKLD